MGNRVKCFPIDARAANLPERPTEARVFSASRWSPRLNGNAALNRVLSLAVIFVVTPVVAQRQAEYLDRGVVAVDRGDGSVLVSWRFLGTDPDEVAFRVYRSVDQQPPVPLTESPIRDSTNFVDRSVNDAGPVRYEVRPLLDGREQPSDGACRYIPGRDYLEIPLQTPDGYQPNDASVGDLDGDGQYEIVLHQAGRGRDNSQSGMTDPPILEAYRLDGTLLWRIHLGRNIREGAPLHTIHGLRLEWRWLRGSGLQNIRWNRGWAGRRVGERGSGSP